MYTDSKFFYNKNLKEKKVNNSSIFTAENSSSIQTNKINSFSNSHTNYIKRKIRNAKYLNSTIFDTNKNKNIYIKKSEIIKNNSNNNFHLYLTETKDTIIPTFDDNKSSRKKNQTIENNQVNGLFLRNSKTKDILPTLKCFSDRNNKNYPEIFTCEDYSLKPKLLTRIYYKRNKSKDELNNAVYNFNNLSKVKKMKESAKDYVNKTNTINLINYCINLKKEALQDYKENMKTQMDSLNKTITKINNYKINLENNLLVKYNEQQRELDKEILNRRLNLDYQKNKLLSLLREVGGLSQSIIKKQSIIKGYEKWLIFQILLKEGSEPKNKNIKEYLDKKYGQNPIFESYDDFFAAFKEKEDNNLRLLERRDKSINECDSLKKEYNELKDEYIKTNAKLDINIQEKEKILNLLKLRNKQLNNIKNNLDKNKNNINYSKSLKKYNSSLNFNIRRNRDKIDIEKDIQLNSLGVYCIDIEQLKNIYQMINCIYYAILKNKIKGFSLPNNIIYRMNNHTLTRPQKAILQIKVIESSLNYIKSSIKEKKNNKKYEKIIKDTYNEIDLYHKWKKAKLYKEKEKRKFSEFLIKMEEKGKKFYFIPHKKVENYTSSLFNKKKTYSIDKNKRNKLELFDFLYDNSFKRKKNNE